MKEIDEELSKDKAKEDLSFLDNMASKRSVAKKNIERISEHHTKEKKVVDVFEEKENNFTTGSEDHVLTKNFSSFPQISEGSIKRLTQSGIDNFLPIQFHTFEKIYKR